ncbi:hypothetical protein [Rhizobium ruizarguesonis]|uniref:hypothetical protein n=1 Tax=Rhizobium ruizarguesonis TaxID=2081791 RepID=UPI0010312B09|nr:hypothetical protein [Rhizobium ruizarguesonis]TBC84228.1 hypothetical protein ELH28_16295 [Rhizobium ruizarguesonis]
MGGVNIYCGSFVGEDKSGTKFETVLSEVAANDGSPNTKKIVLGILESINDADDHILISAEDAGELIFPLTEYLQRLRNDISAGDRREYCAVDLLKACEVAAEEKEPIAIVW